MKLEFITSEEIIYAAEEINIKSDTHYYGCLCISSDDISMVDRKSIVREFAEKKATSLIRSQGIS